MSPREQNQGGSTSSILRYGNEVQSPDGIGKGKTLLDVDHGDVSESTVQNGKVMGVRRQRPSPFSLSGVALSDSTIIEKSESRPAATMEERGEARTNEGVVDEPVELEASVPNGAIQESPTATVGSD